MLKGKYIAFDTETTGLAAWHGDEPFAFAFCDCDLNKVYYELEVDPFTRKVIRNQESEKALSDIQAILEDTRTVKVMHNAKFDVRMMERAYGISVCGPGGPLAKGGRLEETMFMAHACHSLERSFGLKQLSQKYAAFPKEDQEQLQKATARLRRVAKKAGWKIAQEELAQPHGPPKIKSIVAADYWIPRTMSIRHPDLMREGEAELCRKYALLDVERTIIMFEFYREMMEEMGTRDTYDFEISLWPVVYGMETRGLRVDPAEVDKSVELAINHIDAYKPELERVAWKGFNPDSHHHIRELTVNRLHLDPDPMSEPTKKGLVRVGREFLQRHLSNPTVHTIARYRTAVKTFGSFFSRYRKFMTPCHVAPGCMAIHGNIKQVGVATGRLAMSDPNLQNVMDPKVSFAIDPQHVRHVFKPRPGQVWLCVDYSNMEVRVFASIAQEPVMLEDIRTGRDIHSGVANRIWGGAGNPMGISQAIRALSLDGTGIEARKQPLIDLWAEWGLTVDKVRKMHQDDRAELADEWLRGFDYDIVKAQDSVGRRYARNVGKMVTFLKMYGGGMRGARKLLKDPSGQALPDREISEILHGYDASMPRIKEYSYELIHEAKTNGCIWTAWGRRLSVDPDMPYQAVNYMVQGSSADLMKQSMLRCHHFLQERAVPVWVLLSIHDELIFEGDRAAVTMPLIRGICQIMSDSDGRLCIPMPVTPALVIDNWSDKREIKQVV